MGYDLIANNKKLKDFYMGAFTFPKVLEAFNGLFPFLHSEGRYFFIPGKRIGSEYPNILSNDGFKISAEESKIISRFVSNFAKLQEGLHQRDYGGWPEKKLSIGEIKLFVKFSNWAKKSNGFRIC